MKKINTKWSSFIEDLKNTSNPDDQSQIKEDEFLKILRKYNIRINKE